MHNIRWFWQSQSISVKVLEEELVKEVMEEELVVGIVEEVIVELQLCQAW